MDILVFITIQMVKGARQDRIPARNGPLSSGTMTVVEGGWYYKMAICCPSLMGFLETRSTGPGPYQTSLVALDEGRLTLHAGTFISTNRIVHTADTKGGR